MSEPKTEIFEYGGQKIPYRVIFDKHKTVRLRLDSAGCAVVKMPFSLPKDYAQKMLLKHFQWIVQKREETENNSAHSETEEIYIFGKAFAVIKSPVRRREKLNFTAENTYFNQERIFEYALPILQNGHRHICLTNAELFVCCQSDDEWLKIFAKWRKSTAQAFLSWYYKELWQVFREQSARFLLRNNVTTAFHKTLPPLRIRACRRCFGSCRISPKKQETGIMLSSHLLGMPLEYIEFVILHEFCHLVFPNHSSGFYALFGEVLPAHKLLKSAINAWSRTHNPF